MAQKNLRIKVQQFGLIINQPLEYGRTKHGRTKYVKDKYHAVREAERLKEVKLKHYNTDEQPANIYYDQSIR